MNGNMNGNISGNMNGMCNGEYEWKLICSWDMSWYPLVIKRGMLEN